MGSNNVLQGATIETLTGTGDGIGNRCDVRLSNKIFTLSVPYLSVYLILVFIVVTFNKVPRFQIKRDRNTGPETVLDFLDFIFYSS